MTGFRGLGALALLSFFATAVSAYYPSHDQTEADTYASPEALTFVTADPPPATVPEARLAAVVQGNRGSPQQAGVLLMSRWVEDGVPAVVEMPSEINWPVALPLSGSEMVLILETTSAPFIVNINLYHRVDADGLPLDPPIHIDCELDGDPADCQIVVAPEEERVHVRFSMPEAVGPHFVAIYTAWVLDPYADSTPVVDWPVYEAGWLFHIVIGGQGPPVP